MAGVRIRRACVGLALLAVLAGLFLSGCTAGGERGEKAEVLVINVGKGDAILVKTRGRAYLIDAAKAERWGMVQSMLKQEGVTSLNGRVPDAHGQGSCRRADAAGAERH